MIDILISIAPHIKSNYLQAFEQGMTDLYQAGLLEQEHRLCHFLAQICHETNGLSVYEEKLHYRADRLVQVWPSRFQPKGPLDPAEYAHNAERLANEVYGGRMGNTDPGDGYRYRGRGLLQLTGKANYKQATERTRYVYGDAPNFVDSPQDVLNPAWCLRVALSYWTAKQCNALADAGDMRGITKAINGGLIGVEDRAAWHLKISEKVQVWNRQHLTS